MRKLRLGSYGRGSQLWRSGPEPQLSTTALLLLVLATGYKVNKYKDTPGLKYNAVCDKCFRAPKGKGYFWFVGA